MEEDIEAKPFASQQKGLDRCLGTALMAAAAVQLLAGLLHPEDSPAGMVHWLWQPLHMIFFFTLFVVLLAVLRIYGRTSGDWLDSTAVVLFALGIVGFEGLMVLEFGVLPQLAASEATRGLLAETGPLLGGPLGTWLFATCVVFSVGGILFALSLIRSGAWPRWSSALLLISPAVAFSPPLPFWAWKIAFVIFSIGLGDLGRTLWQRGGSPVDA